MLLVKPKFAIYLLEYIYTCYNLLSYVHANENIKFSHGQNNLSELNVQEIPPAPESVPQSSPPPEQCLEWVLGYSRESCTRWSPRKPPVWRYAQENCVAGCRCRHSWNLPAILKELFLYKTCIHMKTGASVNGHLLAQTAVTMQMNTVVHPQT